MIYKCQNCGGTNFKQQGETLTCNICYTTYNRSVLVEILNKNQKSVDEFKQRNDQLIFHEDITIQELIKKIDSLKSDNEHLQETLKEELASLKEVKAYAESYQNKEYSIEEIAKTKYGYVIHTLDDKIENYDKYKRVIFVAPVYFGNIHNEFLKKVYQCRITNLIMVYNGLNKESNKEDEFVKKNINRYKKIKLTTDNIELIKEFMVKEIESWKKL